MVRRSLVGLCLVPVVACSLVAFASTPAYALAVHEYPTSTPGAQPQGLAPGHDGNLWFTESSVNKIGRVTTAGVTTDYSLPSGFSGPDDIAPGPDGNMWFTQCCTPAAIGFFNPATPAAITELTDPAIGSPQGITAGPDGNMWFTDRANGAVGRVLIKSPHTVTEFAFPSKWLFSGLDQRLVVGSDNRLWFGALPRWVVRFDPSTKKFARYDADPEEPTTTHVYDVTPGPGGDIYFTEFVHTSHGDAGDVVKLDTNMNLVGSGAPPGSAPQAISVGPDGNLWTWDATGNQIVQLDGSLNTLTTSAVPTSDPAVAALAPGSDSNLWFTESSPSQIGRVELPHLNTHYVFYIPNFFVKKVAPINSGDTVQWLMLDAGTHGVADSSGLRLFGFGPTGGPMVVPMGEVLSFRFMWAGKYSYDDPFHPASKGKVDVPITVQPAVGAPGADVIWASGDAPAGDVFDVQVKVPGSAAFVDWRAGVTSLSAAFTPSDPLWAGPGTYSFRARLRQPSTGATSGFSVKASISLS